MALSDAVRRLAAADFSEVAERFGAAGFEVGQSAAGILSVTRPGAARPADRKSVV